MNQPVLDVCCGSRMFWFDGADDRAVFGDIRRERHTLSDRSSPGGSRELVIDPDQQFDFRALPFGDDRFYLVVFDPPHLVRNGASGWLAKKYGKLEGDWREDLRAGFAECFRVLKPNGTLIFKWNETDVKVSEILKLTNAKPLFGNRCGKTAKSHWIVFIRPGALEQRSVPVPPNDMPLIEILEKATPFERRDWLLKCPLALLMRLYKEASAIFAANGEDWAVDYIAAQVAKLHQTRTSTVIFESPPCAHFSKAKGGAA